MIKGIRTVIYGVSDIEKGKAWYSEILGKEPYFDMPFYVGFNVGGYELGLNPNARVVQDGNEGVVAYWGGDDIEIEYERLLRLGVKEHGEVTDVGEDIKVATLKDPFGNLFGLIYNPNFMVEGSE